MNIQKTQRGFGYVKVLVSIPLLLIGLMALVFAYTELNKAYWDYRVKGLCEKDGGVTVFETVELTKEEYEMYGGIKGVIPVPSETASYAAKHEYLSSYKKQLIRDSNPSIYRWVGTVYRVSDKKTLGKVVGYHRGGGDFPTIISHPTGFDCKDINIKLDVDQQIFS
ncbi:hypothetical protein LCGC14_2990990, partial [marine sediment metagenome]